MIFEDFTIKELSIHTFEQVQQINLFEAINLQTSDERVIDYAIDHDLNAIAIAS